MATQSKTPKKRKKRQVKRCHDCGMSAKELKEDGYNFKIVRCSRCKNYFCEACLIDGEGCPYCSDIVYV